MRLFNCWFKHADCSGIPCMRTLWEWWLVAHMVHLAPDSYHADSCRLYGFRIWKRNHAGATFPYFRKWHIYEKVIQQSSYFLRRPQKLMKSSLSIWCYVVNVKSTVKILSIFVASLENVNYNELLLSFRSMYIVSWYCRKCP